MLPTKRLMMISLVHFGLAFSQGNQSFLVCYGKFDLKSVKSYSEIILETAHFSKSDIQEIRKNKTKVYGYISLGEVNKNATHYKSLNEDFLGKNKNWDSYYLNLNSNTTKNVLINVIQQMVDKGVDGLFLDNIDNFSSFGQQKNQKEELIKLFSLIKKKFPHLYLIQNSGAELFPETKNCVDAVLFESIFTNYNFEKKKYYERVGEDFINHFKKIKEVEKIKKTRILLIEYADNFEMYQNTVKNLGQHSYDFFIGSIDLQKVPMYNPFNNKRN
ncbi:MAG: endo alpha-1,4 polygalactosaminidase [Flavobacterium sp.]